MIHKLHLDPTPTTTALCTDVVTHTSGHVFSGSYKLNLMIGQGNHFFCVLLNIQSNDAYNYSHITVIIRPDISRSSSDDTCSCNFAAIAV